jgi:ribulose-phosphate 3-epimerase
MAKKKLIAAPSILSADLGKLEEEIQDCKKAGATYLHYDIMDGHFVPNITFGPDFIKRFSNEGLFNDVHLMIDDPIKYAKKCIDFGADLITFHLEAVSDPIDAQEIIRQISPDIKVGISIKPRTPIEKIIPFLNHFDLVLIMSVEPGFGGQQFIPSSLDKIKKLREYIDAKHLNTLIEVDGGINADTIELVRDAGVDVVVAGSFIFKSPSKQKAINAIIGE